MKLERLQELVNDRTGLSIEDDAVVHTYEFNGQKKKASIAVELLLTDAEGLTQTENESVVSDVLDSMLLLREQEQRVQEVDDMQRLVTLASRYNYIRNVILKPMRRKDLPEELGEYFYRDDVDIQYPTLEDIDEAIDNLIAERNKHV